jgi:uncharacterized protein YcbK (DUF882 family)
MNRMLWIHGLGVVGLLVGIPLVLTHGGDRVAFLRPTVSLSMVRSGEPPAPVLGAEKEATVLPPAPRPHVVIEPLAPPPVTVHLENVNTEETATFQIGRAGEVGPEQAADLRHFFRCRRTGREKAIAPATLAMLAEVARHWPGPGHVIEIVSAFRAPPFGAPHSKHFAGHAIDLRVRGVRSAAVRDFIWRDHHAVGVGYYTGENFVHLDSRPGEADMAWTGQGEDGIPSYSPRWAWRARHPAARSLAAARRASRSL